MEQNESLDTSDTSAPYHLFQWIMRYTQQDIFRMAEWKWTTYAHKQKLSNC